WSSDVCSSDLYRPMEGDAALQEAPGAISAHGKCLQPGEPAQSGGERRDQDTAGRRFGPVLALSRRHPAFRGAEIPTAKVAPPALCATSPANAREERSDIAIIFPAPPAGEVASRE